MTARVLRGALLALVVGFSGSCGADGGVGVEAVSEDDQAFDFDYEIPKGTGERIDAGEPIEILPARIEATVGQSIRVRNDDDRGHSVGWMYVGPGEVVTQRFSSSGRFVGACSVHPSGQVELVVE